MKKPNMKIKRKDRKRERAANEDGNARKKKLFISKCEDHSKTLI
jgi:hypothetical protein